MKVIYFTRDFNPHDQRFLTALGKTDHEVYLLRLESNPFTPLPRILPEGIREIEWRGGYEPYKWENETEFITDLQRVFQIVKPDVVHAGPVHTCAYLVAKAGFKPLVTMSWSSDILYETKHDETLVPRAQYALKHTSVLVGDCQAMANEAANTYGFSPENMVLFPWGVDLQAFNPVGTNQVREKLNWQDQFVFVCVRSWEPVYGVDITLKAFGEITKKYHQARLLLYGNGSQAEMVHGMIDQYHMADKVFLGGKIDNRELADIYRSADVYLTSAHSDGSSVSLMEAMASGLPAIASDIPGNMEWVFDGENGLSFIDGDDAMLAEKMAYLLEQGAEVQKMGETARKTAEVRADWSKNFPKLLTAYQQAIKGDDV